MIKAIAGDMLILILTDENLALMKADDPAFIDLDTMGNPKFSKIVIAYEPSLEKAMQKLEPFVGPDTRIHGRGN